MRIGIWRHGTSMAGCKSPVKVAINHPIPAAMIRWRRSGRSMPWRRRIAEDTACGPLVGFTVGVAADQPHSVTSQSPYGRQIRSALLPKVRSYQPKQLKAFMVAVPGVYCRDMPVLCQHFASHSTRATSAHLRAMTAAAGRKLKSIWDSNSAYLGHQVDRGAWARRRVRSHDSNTVTPPPTTMGNQA